VKYDREESERRRAERRAAKYEKKFEPERVAALLARKRAAMVQRYTDYARVAGRIGRVVGDVTDAVGVSSIRRVWYRTFGLEIEKLHRQHPERDITDELKVLRYKWAVRSFDPYLLDKVEAAVLAELRLIDLEMGRSSSWLTNGPDRIQ